MSFFTLPRSFLFPILHSNILMGFHYWFIQLLAKLGVLDPMSAKIKSSNEYSEPARSMGRTLEFKRSSSQQQSTNAVKKKILSTQARQISKFQEKGVVSNSFGQLSSDRQRDGLRQQMDGDVIQQTSPVTRQKQQLVLIRNKDEELVKHMSNLPGYLQQAEKRKNVQVKALNFGVLDWKHLEKWRYNEHMPTKGQPKASSNGNSLGMESKKSRLSITPVGRKQLSAGLQLKSSTKVSLPEDAQQSRGKFKQIQNPQIASGSGQQKDSSQKATSSRVSCPHINHDRDKKKSANQRSISLDTILMSTPPMDYRYSKSRKTGYNDTNGFPKYSNTEPQNIVLLMPKCPSKKSSSQNFRLLESKTSLNGQLAKDARNRYSGCFSSQDLQSGEFCDEIPHSCQNNNSIKSQSSEVKCSKARFCKIDSSLSVDSCKRMDFDAAEQTESRTSSHGQLADCNWNRYSDCFSSQELHYGELHFDIPHSCPIPAPVAISQGKESDVFSHPFQSDISIEPRFSGATCPEATSCNLDDSSASVGSFKGMDLDLTKQTAGKGRHPSPNRRFSFSLGRLSRSFSFKESSTVPQLSFTPAAAKSGRESSEASAAIDDSKRDLDDSSASVESFKGMELDMTKQTASKGRHPSPNRRFSFSLGRLSRSFSFKESSTVPQLSFTPAAVKSGRESSEASAPIDNSKRDNASASGRRRPSPFRSPLLKPKGAHSTEEVQTKGACSAETFQVSEKNSRFVNLQPINTNKPHFNEKNEALTFQALMQLTIKNGHPFFKFVVDNRSDILAAAINQLPTPGKVDSTLTFSFYSVHEIKKKAGAWIHNGSKEKNCGFGYNIIGQMQISRYFSLDRTMVTESVLFDVNIAEGDKRTPEVSPNREIAAIICNEPAAKCNGGESKAGNTDKQKGFLGSSPGNACDGGEKENFNGTTVILPGGLHSLPSNGTPSPLIHRWRSGGLCDCGGWDVGCKLKILTNHNKGSNFSTPDMSCSKLEHMNLFIQGEGKSHPIFSLAPFKDGIYSVEFSASVSLLEAFSICVAVITSQELSDIFDSNRLPDAKFYVEANRGNDVKKNSVTVQGEFPAKYISSPPPSPVGRI